MYQIDYQYIITTPHIPHYRYFFNGQEADNEVYGEGAVLGYEFRQYDARIGRWWSIDPLADKYPGVSPYAFCIDSPLMLVDLKGEDPIYSKTIGGRVKKIGDDGQCGTGAYLVLGSKIKEVKSATKAGEFYCGDLSESNNVIKIPTGQILQGVEQSVELTLNSGTSPETRVEYGGHSLYDDKQARIWDAGTITQSKILPNGAVMQIRSVTPFKIGGKKYQYGGPPETIEFVWHVHTFSSTPSSRDFQSMKDWRSSFKGNAFVVCPNDNKVAFYNEKKVLIRISLENFIKMGKQEDVQ